MGALARWGLGLWLNTGAGLPRGTLAANLMGGYLIGLCIGMFNAEVVHMLQQSRYALALGTAGLHLVGSLLLTLLGLKTAALLMGTTA